MGRSEFVAEPIQDTQTFRERPPPVAVAKYVSCVWAQRVSPPANPYVHRTVPNGSVEISCEIGSLPIVTGPQPGPVVATIAPGTTVIGVRFHPGAAPSVLGVPAGELLGLRARLDELWGRSATGLGERLFDATTASDAAGTLEAEVTARSADVSDPDPLVGEAVRLFGSGRMKSVSDLTSTLRISERHLRRRFAAGLGYGPRALNGILRFQRFLALAHVAQNSGARLAELAAESGYADQAHLTRWSLRLSGLTPKAFLEEMQKKCGPSHDHSTSLRQMLRSAPFLGALRSAEISQSGRD
jgi:AraC-like DNA-binding protein